MKRILLLGGITEALAIARRLGPEHIYSLAGVGRVPTDLACQLKIGGYGGAEGMAQYIREQGIDLLLDATHPYAAQISHNAALAARIADVPCWALRRTAWQHGPEDDWREVADWSALVTALAPFKRPLFTLGREPLQHLNEIPEHQFWTLRALDSYPGNDRCEVIGARGPFVLEDERQLFEQRNIDVLISKNSGSSSTEPKLDVARERGLPVLILKRPPLPEVDRIWWSVDEVLGALRGGALRLSQ
ncbi:cobalt-precorrin-6A reductase [Pseudomonas syringae pv. actinidiae]|uniref:Cobalt-precorrin-6A reductase n=2 Tax=Pseudomonas syringae group TaxID=136849 RepID=A0A0K8M287_PSESF|nr:cobalt-precorrin-6A reductase [Pseudomonas syringae]OZI83723.1 cobalt-precorrin-6A reductase [Pseudomonas avellanae]AKT28804.1 cobalt-precorrin-6X reductase [Pseudomonas syringae pv. actinidiae ICMP 18884]AOE55322.1 cobalt-precorrin-6X reductase [Pseudomonas syringae pv. actinidiae ICMP 18708]APP96182.1 cobalt-precorrin-6A reductase [Pseudomonas syringae pv. actinidiae]APQ02039.1 cobalt-precorrin-6A reductase [Pseudomonas syringae pv. actinidiae]